MTSYMLFAVLGMVIYVGVALAETAIAGVAETHIALGPWTAQCGEGLKQSPVTRASFRPINLNQEEFVGNRTRWPPE